MYYIKSSMYHAMQFQHCTHCTHRGIYNVTKYSKICLHKNPKGPENNLVLDFCLIQVDTSCYKHASVKVGQNITGDLFCILIPYYLSFILFAPSLLSPILHSHPFHLPVLSSFFFPSYFPLPLPLPYPLPSFLISISSQPFSPFLAF
jgi:hypothetical protein